MNNDSETIGQRLREVRGREAMTQAEFAIKMQVSTTTVTRYEGGNTVPDGVFLLKLKELFDVDPSWVLLGKTSDDRSNNLSLELLKELRVTLDQSLDRVIANLEKRKK